MKSKIVRAKVMHARLQPVKHSFVYPVYMYAIDLDELQLLNETIPFFGYNRLRPVSLFDRDYLQKGSDSIADKLNSFLERKNLRDGIKRIVLLTSARFFNYVFNPVSFYYCYDQADSVRCIVAEVNNTFHERHLYVLDQRCPDAETTASRYTVDKQFHVSPFNDMEGQYDFRFEEFNDKLNIRLDILRAGKPSLKTKLWGNAIPFNAKNLRNTILRYPLAAWMTMPRILWQAGKLHYGKRLTMYAKPNPNHSMTIRVARPTWAEAFCASLVFKTFSKFKHGCLSLTLPGGDTRVFGEVNHAERYYMKINSCKFFRRVVLGGDVGFGDSYSAGEWDADDLAGLLAFFLRNQSETSKLIKSWAVAGKMANRLRHAFRKNTKAGSKKNIHDHYDLSNEFFQLFLDPTMTYSSALFHDGAESLGQGQINKLNAIIAKAELKPEDHVLEIGSGWGSMAIQAVRQTGCRVTTITLSEEQRQFAQEQIQKEGLEGRIDVRLCDYRDVAGQYDKVISIEMIEAVGHEYLGAYFNAIDRLLKPNGIAVIQAIAIIDKHYDAYRFYGDWIQKRIFPGAVVPSLKAMIDALAKDSTFFVNQIENIGMDYARTLRQWREALRGKREEAAKLGFDKAFMRVWDYYFSYCEAGFSTRKLNTLQIVLKRPAMQG